jgi:hypothetical protein
MTSKDPLLQPFQLKHLTLRNRIMSSAHEPSYSEDGMPKDRYRLYHVEKAKGGIALTMTAGSAIVAEDSPAAFGNLHAYKDEIVPWLERLANDCHEQGAAVMIQITHLGRRTNWNKADWLPVLAPSPLREPAHRAFPKEAEDWDLDRIVKAYAAAAERMKAAGLDGVEIEAYGHFLDGFWSPATNKRSSAFAWSRTRTGRRACRARRVSRSHGGWSPRAKSTSSTSSADTSKPTSPCPGLSRSMERRRRRISTSPGKCVRKPSSRSFTAPASTTWRRRVTLSPTARSIWWA